MFYCETCRKERNWPDSFSQSSGKCEICGNRANCWDRPSSSLPPEPSINRSSGRYIVKDGKVITPAMQIQAVNALVGMIASPKPAPEEDDEMPTNKTLLERLREPCGKVTGHGEHCVKGYLCGDCQVKEEAAKEIERLKLSGVNATINLNDQYKAVLTATGARLRNEYYADIRKLYPSVAPALSIPGDVVTEHLWEMMRIYGPTLHNGMSEVPFEKNQIVSTFWD